MTKKDFELIAAAIRRGAFDKMGPVRTAIHNDYAARVADALATTNPKFDRARFLAACGVSS